MTDQVALQAFVRDELRQERHADSRRLVRHGYKVFSQGDEDGIIAEIFRRIGPGDKRFVEIGVQIGVECNTTWLLYQQWRGLWLEADGPSVDQMRTSHQQFINAGRLDISQTYVDAANINGLFATHLGSAECDLFSIDIDYNDYWVWQALTHTRPRVVVAEYNARWVPPSEITVAYDTTKTWAGNCHFGASLGALNRLAVDRGYSLVGCSLTGVNAFFVRNDLLGDHFLRPGDLTEHYEPARYFLVGLESGHPAAIGPVVNLADPGLAPSG
jgi:hypothetical protein